MFVSLLILLFALCLNKVVASVCSDVDNTEPAKCFMHSESEMYSHSAPVLRVWLRFEETHLFSHCTAWLLGCEGHVLTNKHCVETQEEAQILEFEVMAEGDTCEDQCNNGTLPCPGTLHIDEPLDVIKTGTTKDMDYTLLLLPEAYRGLWKDLGYLQLRQSPPEEDERIYVPQHPLGYGKRLAVRTDDEFTHIVDTNVDDFNSCGNNLVTHNADTASGASGSPILSYYDNTVIALHHCGGCDEYGVNAGIPSDAIIRDLGNDLPQCAVAKQD